MAPAEMTTAWDFKTGSDGEYSISFISNCYAPTTWMTHSKILDCPLTSKPELVIFFVPGNPGVASAYVQFAKELVVKMMRPTLFIFSSHLGHLSTPNDPTRMRTCEENIVHQLRLMKQMVEELSLTENYPELVASGHSAGAFFTVNSLHRLLRDNEEIMKPYKDNLKLLLYCGTISKFGPTGRFRASVATKRTEWITNLRQSSWYKTNLEKNPMIKKMDKEFSNDFVRQAALLCVDELKVLPDTELSQLELIESMGIESFFFYAARDAYVSQRTQTNVFNRFGPERVFIGRSWYHAFSLHQPSREQVVKLSHDIIKESKFGQADQLESYYHTMLSRTVTSVRLSLVEVMIITIVWTRHFGELFVEFNRSLWKSKAPPPPEPELAEKQSMSSTTTTGSPARA